MSENHNLQTASKPPTTSLDDNPATDSNPDLPDLTITGYKLEIFDCKCQGCGHSWTTCCIVVRHNTGYSYNITPAIHQAILAHPHLIEGFHHSESIHPICFRCLPLTAGEGWQTSARTADTAELNKQVEAFLRNKPQPVRQPVRPAKYNLLDD